MPLPRFSPKVAALLGLSLLSSFATFTAAQPQPQDPSHLPYVYRWSFEIGGTPDTDFIDSTFGGELAVAGGITYQVPLFERKGGVSEATPGVLNASRNKYGHASGAQVNSYGSPLRTERSAGRFTITMWIKPELAPDKQSQARLFNLSTESEEQSPQSVLISLEAGSFAFGVNGSAIYRVDATESVVKTGEWVFLVFCYDGVTENPYYSQELVNLFECPKNGAILAGDLKRPTRLISQVALHTGAPNYNVPPGKLSMNGLLAAIGSSNSRFDRSFVGWIDDVRIYDGLLSQPELERVRLEALGK
jgi:hypothetical protein